VTLATSTRGGNTPSSSPSRTSRPSPAAITRTVLRPCPGSPAATVDAKCGPRHGYDTFVYRYLLDTFVGHAPRHGKPRCHRAPPAPTGDPFANLVAELARFRRFVMENDATALAALALLDGTDPRVRDRLHRQLVEPQRRRFRACLRAGVDAGALRAQADHATA